MRPFLLFCLLFGAVVPVYGETPEKTSEADLVRSYFSALPGKDNSGKIDEVAASKALTQLKEQFPESSITQFISEHWTQQLEWRDWNGRKAARIKKRIAETKSHSNENPLIVVVYQVADLVVPIGATHEAKAKLRENAKALVGLLNDSCFKDDQEENAVFVETNLSLVIRATAKSQSACKRLLSQLRGQQDVQVSYEITLAAIPAELANALPLREIISPAVFAKRKQLLQASGNASIVMSPKLTLFNGQNASIATEEIQVELHSELTGDRRAIRTEVNLELQTDESITPHKFSSSEEIPDGRTAIFFIRTEKTSNAFYDRRLLIENGVDVKPSQEDQLYLFLTPRVIIAEEEEELLLGQQSNQKYPAYSQTTAWWPDYSQVPVSWTPAKLEWDDGAWDLDFSNKTKFDPNHPWNLNWPGHRSQRKTNTEIPSK